MVQSAHSALEAGSHFKEKNCIPNLVLIQIRDEEHLKETAEFLRNRHIRFHMFFEPDNDMGFSSITTEPLCYERKKKLSNFKLWRA